MTSKQINDAIRTAYATKGYNATILALNALVMSGKILPSDRWHAIETLNFLHHGAEVFP